MSYSLDWRRFNVDVPISWLHWSRHRCRLFLKIGSPQSQVASQQVQDQCVVLEWLPRSGCPNQRWPHRMLASPNGTPARASSISHNKTRRISTPVQAGSEYNKSRMEYGPVWCGIMSCLGDITIHISITTPFHNLKLPSYGLNEYIIYIHNGFKTCNRDHTW